MEEEKKEEKTLLLSPEKRTSSVPNIMGWTITKPITHHPQIILRDESNEIAEVSVKIALSDATNITFSDLFFVHCTKSFAGKGGELAMYNNIIFLLSTFEGIDLINLFFRERGLAKIVLEGIALSQGVLLEGGIATGGLSLTEEFSHQAKVSSIKRTFEKVERVIFFVRQEEEKKEGAKVFALPNKKSLANTVLARYVKIQRLYNHHQHIHINQLEVFDEKNSKLK